MTERIQLNLEWLRQASDLLNRLSSSAFGEVSGHMRHILEFYECFLEGLPSGRIDYDARKRDQSIERSAVAADARIHLLSDRLKTAPELRGDALVWVRLEESDATSSVGRELQVLSSHTVHHFALIALTLRAHGVAVDPKFGVAPSTLRYRESKAEAA
ncbi:MAG TPA: hypothetical protein VGP79_07395 [Bryobacteraceae bacterium]|jgi:uncharacterized damage-inducible protein DinB|nr:hypothetical protein [Bryobacteraceae bacterium]